MIDFRYHLVSLISVFLALAVGIVLGAGPLREGISDALTGQVQELRTDRDKLRTELDAAGREALGRGNLITAVQPEAVKGVLEGQKVAIVTLPGAGEIEPITTALTQAGAAVVSQTEVSEAMVDAETATFRSSFASQLTTYLKTEPAADASTEEILGQALASSFALTGSDQQRATTLTEFLTTNDPAFATIVTPSAEAATAIVVIGAPHAEVKPEDAETVRELGRSYTRVANGMAEVLPTLVVGSAQADTDLVALLRASAMAETLPAVDSVASPVAAINAPRALAERLGGGAGQYGIETGASAPLAPHTVAPQPTPPAAEPEGAEPSESPTSEE